MKSQATKEQNKLVLLSLKARLSVVCSKLSHAKTGGSQSDENISTLEATRRSLQALISAFEAEHFLAVRS